MSSSNWCFLTRIQVFQEQVKWSGIPISLIFLFVVIQAVKDFSIASEAEVDIFLEFSCFFYDPTDIAIVLRKLDICIEKKLFHGT